MTIKRRKTSASVEHRLTKLEEGLKSVRSDIAEVMSNVTNHIPTSINAVKQDLETLLDRKKESEAVKLFFTNFFKFSASIAALVWTVLQIIKIVKGWN